MKTDLELQLDVIDQLRWDPLLKASDIGVAVHEGIVSLSGKVDSYLKKVEAEKKVKKVSGVKAVVINIQVGVSPGHERTDTEIAEAILNSLKWHTSVPDEHIKVKVEKGIVTLWGTVDWEYQRMAVRNLVAGLVGVVNVINQVQLRTGAVEIDIRQKIENAFQRNAIIDACQVEVVVDGARVILKGNVRSVEELEEAESAALSAEGINEVENHLQVTL